jgi:hypothetical protein
MLGEALLQAWKNMDSPGLNSISSEMHQRGPHLGQLRYSEISAKLAAPILALLSSRRMRSRLNHKELES